MVMFKYGSYVLDSNINGLFNEGSCVLDGQIDGLFKYVEPTYYFDVS